MEVQYKFYVRYERKVAANFRIKKKYYRFRQNLVLKALHQTSFLRAFRGLYTEQERDEWQIVGDSGNSGYGYSSDNIVTVRRTERGHAF